jgi:formate dehydrogenase subunit delta
MTSADRTTPVTARRVTREANLIARNFACLGASAAAAATAAHIQRFWAPQLRATLLAQARSHPARFSSIASDAVAMMNAPR